MDIHAIGGQHLYYLETCKRQLWLYLHRIDLEKGFEPIEWGRLVHEEHFNRKLKELQIDGIKVDFIDEDGYVHETKSSKRVKPQHEAQPLFYAYYLNRVLGYKHIRGAKIHYPEIKQVVKMDLTEERVLRMEERIEQILMIAEQKEMPEIHPNRRLCRRCAFFEFCHI